MSSVDCHESCRRCVQGHHLVWFCRNCWLVDRRTLIARSLSTVTVPNEPLYFWAESNKVHNYKKGTLADNLLPLAGTVLNIQSMEPFVCGVCRARVGYRQVRNHCPSTRRSIVKNIQNGANGALEEIPAGTYTAYTHRLIYNILCVDELVHAEALIAPDPAPVPVPVLQPVQLPIEVPFPAPPTADPAPPAPVP